MGRAMASQKEDTEFRCSCHRKQEGLSLYQAVLRPFSTTPSWLQEADIAGNGTADSASRWKENVGVTNGPQGLAYSQAGPLPE